MKSEAKPEEGKEYGVLTYDIPQTHMSLYGKLRSKIGKYALPITQSCYIIPWGMRDQAIKILQEVDGAANGKIMYDCLKFDNSDPEAIERAATRSLKRMLKEVRDYVYSRIVKAQNKLEDGDMTPAECREAKRVPLARAKGRIKNIRWIATLFELSSSVDQFLDALDQYIEDRRRELRDEVRLEVQTTKAAAKTSEEVANA